MDWCSGARKEAVKAGAPLSRLRETGLVDVRDVAAVHGLAYELLLQDGGAGGDEDAKRERGDGAVNGQYPGDGSVEYSRRFLCMPPKRIFSAELCSMLREAFPALAGRVPELDAAISAADEAKRTTVDTSQTEALLGRAFRQADD